jgi:hypothetical protein
MTLREKINSNLYLKVSNCTDIADLEVAMDMVIELEKEFGETKKTQTLWLALWDKKRKLEAKSSTSNIHPIFEQVLKPFGIK